MSGGAEWPSETYKVVNSGRKEHIPVEIAEKWETCTPMSKALMGDSQPVNLYKATSNLYTYYVQILYARMF